MADTNTGSIYVEIRAALDKLQSDVDKAQGLFRNMAEDAGNSAGKVDSKFNGMSKNVAKSLKDMSNTGINKFTGMMQGMQKAIMAAPIVGLILAIVATVKKAFTGLVAFINNTSDAYHRQQTELATLRAVLQSTGAAAWTSAGQLESMARSLSKATGVATNEIMAFTGGYLQKLWNCTKLEKNAYAFT